MSQHTPEPWKVGAMNPSTIYRTAKHLTQEVSGEVLGALYTAEDSQRAVVCVNGCKGFSQETLEKLPVGGITQVYREAKALLNRTSTPATAQYAIAAIDGCAGLNPAAFQQVVEALKVCRSRIIALTGNIESCDMHPADEEAERLANDALAAAQGGQP